MHPLTLGCRYISQLKVALDVEALCATNPAKVVHVIHFEFFFPLEGRAEPSEVHIRV